MFCVFGLLLLVIIKHVSVEGHLKERLGNIYGQADFWNADLLVYR